MAIPDSVRNYRLSLLFSICMNTPLYWPYMFYYVTVVSGLSAGDYGVLKGIYYFTVVLSEVPFGVLADKLSRKGVLIAGAVSNALGCLLYALGSDFGTFVAAEIVFGFATALVSGAGSALLYDSFVRDDREPDYARFEGRIRAAMLLAFTFALPATDFFLVRGGDPTLAYTVSAPLAFLGVVAAALMVDRGPSGRASAVELGRRALRDVRTSPAILAVILYSAGAFSMMRAANSLVMNPVLEVGGVPLRLWGTVTALISLVGAVAAWRVDGVMRAWGRRTVLIALPAVLVGMYLLLAVAEGYVVVPLLALQGIAVGAVPILVLATLNREVTSASHRATVLSVESLVSRASYGIVVIAVGALMDVVSLPIALLAIVGLAGIPLGVAAGLWQKTEERSVRRE